MKPMLAHVYEAHRVTYPVYCQPKLNGIRALYQGGAFQSRDQLPFTPGLLEHLAAPLRETFGPEVILDGELYVHGWPLQRINAAVTPVRLQPTEDTRLVEYHVFDVVDFGKSFRERSMEVWELQNPALNIPVFRVRTSLINNEIEANNFYTQVVASGYEGMMYRLGDCPYTIPKQLVWNGDRKPGGRSKWWSDADNRTWHLLKRKDWQDDEFECVGVAEGEGKLQGTLGALTCRLKDKNPDWTTFSVGSGLTDAERAHYWASPPVGHLVKVKYLCLSSDGIPLNPTILAIL